MATIPSVTIAAIAAITTIVLWIKPDPTTIGLAITAIAGLAGWHLIKNTGQTSG